MEMDDAFWDELILRAPDRDSWDELFLQASGGGSWDGLLQVSGGGYSSIPSVDDETFELSLSYPSDQVQGGPNPTVDSSNSHLMNNGQVYKLKLLASLSYTSN